MNIVAMVLLLTLASCTSGVMPTRTPQQPQSSSQVVRESAAPNTMKEWIAQRNAKREKCTGTGWQGSGGNGYDSFSEHCVNGILVYTDTTKETQEAEAKEAARKFELAAALVSRCLSAKEFAEVTAMGYYIYTSEMQPYYPEDLRQRFNAALQTQQILRQKCP